MVTSMPTTRRLMQQMARMRWDEFASCRRPLPWPRLYQWVMSSVRSYSVNALRDLDAVPAKRILSIPFARHGLLTASTNYPKWQAALWQWEDTRQPQYESGAERLWTIVVIVDCGQASITVFGDTPIDAGQDREVQPAQNLVFEFRLATG
jgi:hypothetical protein